jgi:DNA polymerase phi
MFFPAKKSKNKKAHKAAAEDSADAPLEAVDIMVDTIIGFLEKSTAYMRAVGNQVFSLISSSVQASTIDLILTVRCFEPPHEYMSDLTAHEATRTAEPW